MRFKGEQALAQKTLVDQKAGITYLLIREIFRLAGKRYGFPVSTGIGINLSILTLAQSRGHKLRIFVGPQDREIVAYQVEPEQAIEGAFRFNSYYDPPGPFHVRLAELPFSDEYFKRVSVQDDPILAEAWFRLYQFEQGKIVTAPLLKEIEIKA
ncbi:MAG: hypothetical protein ACYC7D_10430 [Nitrososphaerales archaeon]